MLTAAAAQYPPHRHYSKWSPLKEQLDAWVFTEDFAVTVGNATHPRLFNYTTGTMTLHKKVETESTSKWPVAMMLTGLVADGTIKSLDSRANEYLPWWTSDPEDNRHNVTLRNFLSFTSGFGSGDPGEENTTKTCMDDPFSDFMKCARTIYEMPGINKHGPGREFAYNSYHLQLAGAIAVSASKLSIQKVVDKYLYKAYGMVETTCGHGLPNPQLATCLQTTGADYEKFLHKTLNHFPSREMVLASEIDYTADISDGGLYGDYGFGHFLECFDSSRGYTERCAKANVHIDPGAFGFFPAIDRTNDYFYQVVAEESGKFYARSGIPEYLALLIKPLIDATMSDDYSFEELRESFESHDPRMNSLSLVDVNYIAGCYANPSSCTDSSKQLRRRYRSRKP